MKTTLDISITLFSIIAQSWHKPLNLNHWMYMERSLNTLHSMETLVPTTAVIFVRGFVRIGL